MGWQWLQTSRRIHIFQWKRNKNHELGTELLCIRESCQQLRGLSLLVIGCHKTKLCGLSQRANYTNRATAGCW
jgi:hypothetical protein